MQKREQTMANPQGTALTASYDHPGDTSTAPRSYGLSPEKPAIRWRAAAADAFSSTWNQPWMMYKVSESQ